MPNRDASAEGPVIGPSALLLHFGRYLITSAFHAVYVFASLYV